jgi:hypothetical protein
MSSNRTVGGKSSSVLGKELQAVLAMASLVLLMLSRYGLLQQSSYHRLNILVSSRLFDEWTIKQGYVLQET